MNSIELLRLHPSGTNVKATFHHRSGFRLRGKKKRRAVCYCWKGLGSTQRTSPVGLWTPAVIQPAQGWCQAVTQVSVTLTVKEGTLQSGGACAKEPTAVSSSFSLTLQKRATWYSVDVFNLGNQNHCMFGKRQNIAKLKHKEFNSLFTWLVELSSELCKAVKEYQNQS